MKTLFIMLLSASMLMVSCRSQDMVPADPPPVPEEETIPEPDPEPTPDPEEIRVVEEHITFDREEDEATQIDNTYFVILGSFIEKNNAENFMVTLRGQNFNPTILLSETGFHRVSVDSYQEEAPARRRIQHIRTNYPEYHDTWLLIRIE